MILFIRSRSNSVLARATLLLLLLFSCVLTAAAEGFDWKDKFQLHGFLTQGYVKTTDNRFFGDSNSSSGSLEFTEIGLNASLRLHPQWLIAGQLLSRRAGDMYDGSPVLDYGLVDFTAVNDGENRLGLIVGRFKNPLGLYNDTRDVAFTRPSIFLPQAVYWDRVRNMMLSNDGIQLYGDLTRGLHNFSLQLGAGKSTFDDNVEWSYLGNDWQGDLDQQGLTYVGRLLYDWDGERIRLGLSGASAIMDFERGISDPIGSGKIDVDYWVASFQYNADRWSVTAEYMSQPVTWRGFGPLLDNSDSVIDGFYLQGQYRFAADWEWLLRYEDGRLSDNGSKGARAAGVPDLPDWRNYHTMWTTGLRWQPWQNFMLRAEYSRVEGTFFLSNKENTDPADLVKRWDMFSLLASFRF